MFEPVEHLQRLYSASTTRSATRSSRRGPSGSRRAVDRFPPVLCELKVDGLAVDIVYERGPAAVAGDPRRRPGRRGRHLQRAFIPAIPASADRRPAMRPVPELVEVRGEVFFPVADFERTQRRAAGRWGARRSPTRATPRPGTLRQRIDRRENELARRCRARGGSGRSATAGALERAEGRVARMAAEVERVRSTWAPAPDGPRDRRRQGSRSRPSPRRTRCCAAGACRPRDRAEVVPDLDAVRELHRLLRRAPPRRRARDRRRRRQGRRPRRCRAGSAPHRGRRAGRSPTSTRPRWSAPGCSTSRSTSGAPVGSPRSP